LSNVAFVVATVKLGLSSPGLNDCYSQSCESFDGLRFGGEKLGDKDERHHTHSSSSSVEKYNCSACVCLSSVAGVDVVPVKLSSLVALSDVCVLAPLICAHRLECIFVDHGVVGV
jgi:hypothetical protein